LAERRSLPLPSLFVFAALLAVAVVLSVYSGRVAFANPGSGLARLAVGTAVFLVVIALECRLWLSVFPLPHGPIVPKSRGEFAYCVYMFFEIVIIPIIHSSLFPFPLRGVVYSLMGMRTGKNFVCSGVILDPPLVTAGDNVQIGFDAVLSAHAFSRDSYDLLRIRLGNDITVGLRAIIMPGVVIEDGAVVAAGAVVTKDTRIGAGEVWGGIPARLLSKRQIPLRSLAAVRERA
jgi:hypothetical protein